MVTENGAKVYGHNYMYLIIDLTVLSEKHPRHLNTYYVRNEYLLINSMPIQTKENIFYETSRQRDKSPCSISSGIKNILQYVTNHYRNWKLNILSTGNLITDTWSKINATATDDGSWWLFLLEGSHRWRVTICLSCIEKYSCQS